MKKPLLIYGAGGLGRELLSFIARAQEWDVKGFLDDAQIHGKSINGLTVLGGISYLNNYAEPVNVVLAVGDPATKRQIFDNISNDNVSFPTIIHPSAILQDRNKIFVGEGVVICAGVVCTTDIKIGDFVMVNLNATIGHDVSIGSFSSIMPSVNVAGYVTVGEEVLIGSGASIRNNVQLGKQAVIGMGSVVLQDVAPANVVAGVPAKIIRE